jgi:hypothetical protein
MKKYDLNRKEKKEKGQYLRKLRYKLDYGVMKMADIMAEYNAKNGYTSKLTHVQILDIELCRTNYTINSLYDYELVLNSELLKTKIG